MSFFSLGLLAPFLCIKQKIAETTDNSKRDEDNNDYEQVELNDPSEDYEEVEETYFSKLKSFYKAPFVYFGYESIFFVGFLLLFSYTILCDFKFDKNENLNPSNHSGQNKTVKISRKFSPSVNEIILVVWVVFIVIEEIYQANSKLTLVLKFSNFNIQKNIYRCSSWERNTLKMTGTSTIFSAV